MFGSLYSRRSLQLYKGKVHFPCHGNGLVERLFYPYVFFAALYHGLLLFHKISVPVLLNKFILTFTPKSNLVAINQKQKNNFMSYLKDVLIVVAALVIYDMFVKGMLTKKA